MFFVMTDLNMKEKQASWPSFSQVVFSTTRALQGRLTASISMDKGNNATHILKIISKLLQENKFERDEYLL